MIRFLICTAVLLGCLLLWPQVARAAPDTVTLDLRPQAGEVPTHLCVVSEARGPRTRNLLWELLESKPEQTGEHGRAWRIKPEAWGGTTADRDRQRCGDDPVADCGPRVELPEGLGREADLFVACTADSLVAESSHTKDPRVLVVLLEHLGGSPPSISSVRLAGGIATIGVQADLDRVVVTASSLGGNYLPHRRSFRSEGQGASKLVVLAIEPRCQWMEVALPRARLTKADHDRLTVRAHGVPLDADRCVDALGGGEVIRVRVPMAPLLRGRLDVEIEDASGAGPPEARFGGRWNGLWPPSPFELKLNILTFRWQRPECIYPTDRCPRATLETGTICAATVTELGCDYRCPGEVDEDKLLDLELPLDVTFEKDAPRQRWTDKLAQKGQTLSSYVPPEDIKLDANLNRWRTQDPGNRITHVEIFGSDGTVRKFGVTHVPNLRLPIPDASCEPLRFRPIGDRHYEEGIAQVKEGKVDFGRPERTARITSFNVALAIGAGPAWSTRPKVAGQDVQSPPVYFMGMAQFAGVFRPRKPGWSRITVELRGVATIGQWGYVEDYGDVAEDAQFKNLTWARFLFEPAVAVDAAHRLALALGGGIGTSWPVNRASVRTGEGFTFIGSPSFDARLKVSNRTAVLVQVRGIFGEKEIAELVPDDGTQPDPGQRSYSAYSLVTFVGAVLSF